MSKIQARTPGTLVVEINTLVSMTNSAHVKGIC